MNWGEIFTLKAVFTPIFFVLVGLSLSFVVFVSSLKLLILRRMGKSKNKTMKMWQIVTINILSLLMVIILFGMLNN